MTAAVGVWIDFNRNGNFETGEKILTSGSNSISVITGQFVVPLGAYNGTLTTRMRVVNQTSTPNACGTFPWGEVEDYAVKFIDTHCSGIPGNISVNNITSTTAGISWNAVTNATYVLRYRVAQTNTWTTITLTNPPVNIYSFTGLSEQTQYEVQVAAVCNGAQGAYSPSTTFTTLPLQYCGMSGTGSNDHISNVIISSSNLGVPIMNNSSSQTNYIKYTAPNTLVTLDIGSQNNSISVQKSWTGGIANDAAITAWIDFDRNGVFEVSEQIFVSPASTASPVSATFAVPPNAYSGPLTTTMRVVLQRSGAPVMCQNAVNGEVEDYPVKLRPCSNSQPNQPTITPTHNSATISWTGVTNNVSYVVRYRIQGLSAGPWTLVYASTLLGNIPLIVTGLASAKTYEVQIAALCGDVVGPFTSVKTFETRCDPTPPNITISNVTANSVLVTWAPLATGSAYVMRWRKVGETGWLNPVINLPVQPTNTYTLSSLNPNTKYEIQIANQCSGENTLNAYSTPVIFTTEKVCKLPPLGLTIINSTPNTAEIKWDPFPGAKYLLRYRKVGIPSWTNIITTNSNYTITGLAELTKYEMQVANMCSGISGDFTPLYLFTIPTVIYCPMAAENGGEEYISKVTVIPNGKPVMENISGASNYTNYTGTSSAFIQLIQGSADNEIVIEKKWLGATRDEGIAVWIDFDRNGYFDIYERVFVSPPNATNIVKGKFSVPADAFISMIDYKYVVMRVIMQKGSIPLNCTSFDNGEVEDYSVRISKPTVPNPVNQNDVLIYPNPVSKVLHIKNISKRAEYRIYNTAAQIIGQGILLNGQINVSKLINGVYIIEIEDNGKSVQKKFIKE
ncbi:GEVED domain-containing protein [Chryseobacterium sp.]|uniref:GEVED domain-containing protein n=1 Tax=Chryseobacterium sp. TaxID=1871047 RepID=UPI0028A224CB|nr:GEVED domain-containing protein [Chryseobacterium sp.]